MKLFNIHKLSLAGVLVLRLTPTNAFNCSRLFCCWKNSGDYDVELVKEPVKLTNQSDQDTEEKSLIQDPQTAPKPEKLDISKEDQILHENAENGPKAPPVSSASSIENLENKQTETIA